MPGRCLDIASISRYLHQLAELEDVLHVEGHVGSCARCREKLQRMKRYTETLFDEHDPSARCESACPSLIALEHFRRNALGERQMIRIQSHLRDCAVCNDWVEQRQPRTVPWISPVLSLPGTRPPDLDYRVARQGVRIAAGAETSNLQSTPTLLQRLDLPDPGTVSPSVTIHRSVSFQVPGLDLVLRGRVDFLGYEGFRLTLHWPRGGAPSLLHLWTREHIEARWALGGERGDVSCLLMPGHYFVGTAPAEEPLLALSVEPEFLTPEALAACGYAACRAGRFSHALGCFAQAARLVPAQNVYESMHGRTAALARRFGLAERDADIRWDVSRTLRRAEASQEAPLPPGGDAVEWVARLVETLVRQAPPSPPPRTPGAVVHLSRRRFRPAYAQLMQHLWESMRALQASVESPITRS